MFRQDATFYWYLLVSAKRLSTTATSQSAVKPGTIAKRGLSRSQHSVFAHTRSSISGNPAQTMILRCDCNAGHTHQDSASDGLPPILYSMACHRRGASLVACRTDLCGSPVDRPIDNHGAHPTPLAGLDSPQAGSRTLPIHSAPPNLGRTPARCKRRTGHA